MKHLSTRLHTNFSDLEINHVYEIEYQCIDIGYGVESGNGEFVFRGRSDTWGKGEFQPLDGSPTLYLFEFEVHVTRW